MYSVQYSSIYKNRYTKLSPSIVEYGKEKGYFYTEYLQEGEIFLVGILEIKYTKEKVLKEYNKFTRGLDYKRIAEEVLSVPSVTTYDTEYFLESPVLERVQLVLEIPASENGNEDCLEEKRNKKDLEDGIIDGIVIGVLGTVDEENRFLVREIVHSLDSLKNTEAEGVSVSVLGGEGASEDNKIDANEREGKKRLVICADWRNFQASISESVCVLFLNSLLRDSPIKIANNIYTVPDISEYPLYMIPWISENSPVHNALQEKGIKAFLPSPCIYKIGGVSVGIVNIVSVQSILKYHSKEGVEGYIAAVRAIIRNRHLSPLSPFSCPTLPSEIDEFVVEKIPDVFVVKCPFNLVQRAEVCGRIVHILLMKDISVIVQKTLPE